MEATRCSGRGVLGACSSQDGPVQKVHRMGMHEGSLRTVSHRCEQSALRQGRTRRDTISGRLSSIDPVQVRTRGACVVQRGTEGQIKGISKTPRRGDQDVSPLGGLRRSEDELLSGDSPARSPQQGAPDITHGIISCRRWRGPKAQV